ncbi:MAG: DUF2293 domain-containing protein [Gemmataceae bacterium]|nr:DUF2293 domain-containing protein [Gemmataceae bacterium]
MPESRTLRPTSKPGVFLAPDGTAVHAPEGWEALPPGDAGLTRRVKALGDTIAVVEMRGRKAFSRGLWADAKTIAQARAEVEAERASPSYAKRQASAAKKREAVQAEYVEDFRGSVAAFLSFQADHAALQARLVEAVAAHATPVGSGTVARTKRIPIEERAEAAVIAWLRHQTTAYDHMRIDRVRGARRRVRQQLASISRGLLDAHRRAGPHDGAACPLCKACPA